jgi:drug/metabolite transporter (DMT)-like permease
VGSAVAFGFGDYAAAMSTRRVGVLRTSLGMQTIGLVLYSAALLALGRFPVLLIEEVPYAIVLGVVGVASLALLYRAFAVGPIAVVSPIVASYAALTIVLIVVFLGERLSLGQAFAIVVTFVGVVIASTDLRAFRASVRHPGEGVRLGLISTIGFAIWSTVYSAATKQFDAFSIIVLLRLVSIAVLTTIVLARRTSLTSLASGRTLALVTTVGILDTGANALLGLGIERGYASFVMTGSGAYPIIPAVLAILVLRERLAPNQYVGVAILVAGLIALGLQS